ncbi:MAG: TolC family protein [Bacteroidales bacterium]|nr:TolC family protein [Bacteroidales bacterium]
MLKIYRLLLIILVLYLDINTTNAQKLWTLEDCINYALENNIQVKRQKLAADVAENNFQQSKAEVLPNLNAGAGHSFNYGRSVDPTTYEYSNDNFQSGNLGIESSVNLFNGLQTYNNIKRNEFDLMKNLEDVEKIKNDISLNIATAYLQILFNKEILDIASAQMEVTLQQIEKTQKLVQVGNVAKSELLNIQAQAASEKVNLIGAKNDLDISYLTLTQLLDLDSVGDFAIATPADLDVDTLEILLTIEETYINALENLPQIRSAEYKLKSFEKSLNIAKGQLYPSLGLRGQYYSNYTNHTYGDEPLPSYRQQLENNQYKYINIGLSIPIFNRYSVKTSIDNAKINVLDAQFALEQEKQILYKEIQQAHADAFASLEKYKSSREAVVYNEESFMYTSQKFEVGLVSSIDYNIAKNNFMVAKSKMLQAKYEYIFKTKVLDFYTGKPLVF